jgi:hypothetical protein
LIVALSFFHLGADLFFCFSFTTWPATIPRNERNNWFATGSRRFDGRLREKEREHGSSGVCNNQLVGRGGGRVTKTQQLCSEFGASSKPSTADLAPKHNNQQHCLCSSSQTNGGQSDLRRGVGIANFFIACLACYFVLCSTYN